MMASVYKLLDKSLVLKNEIFIFAFLAFCQVRSRHFLLKTKDRAEAGADYNDAYPTEYDYTNNYDNGDYQKKGNRNSN